MRGAIIHAYYRFLAICLCTLPKRSISPTLISIGSLFLSLVAAASYSKGLMLWGGAVLLLSGFMDTLDGTIARLSGKATKFGALLDSSLDRWADFFVYAGLLIYYRGSPVFYAVLLSIIGSFMVSYVKARAESLGKIRVVGLMQRPERVLLLAVASFLVPVISRYYPNYREVPVIVVLCFMAVFTNITAMHRLLAARSDLSQQE